MALYYGDFTLGDTIQLPFDTSAGGLGSVTIEDADATDILLYKASTTQRTSTSGFTLFIDYDGITGIHLIQIDTSNNADPGFFTDATYYKVLFGPYTLASQIFTSFIGTFSLGIMAAHITAALTTVTYAEPGQADLPATPTIREMIHYPYKFLRNDHTHNKITGDVFIYNNNGTTVGQKAVVTEVSGVVTRTKYQSGP